MPGNKSYSFGGAHAPEFWDRLWRDQIIGIARIKAGVKPKPVKKIDFRAEPKWE